MKIKNKIAQAGIEKSTRLKQTKNYPFEKIILDIFRDSASEIPHFPPTDAPEGKTNTTNLFSLSSKCEKCSRLEK